MSPIAVSAQYNVKQFGAKGDGLTLDTGPIQRTIDEAYKNKGGRVDVPPGKYKIGTLVLKDILTQRPQSLPARALAKAWQAGSQENSKDFQVPINA